MSVCLCVRACVRARVREASIQLSNQMTDRISQSLLMPYDTEGWRGAALRPCTCQYRTDSSNTAGIRTYGMELYFLQVLYL